MTTCSFRTVAQLTITSSNLTWSPAREPMFISNSRTWATYTAISSRIETISTQSSRIRAFRELLQEVSFKEHLALRPMDQILNTTRTDKPSETTVLRHQPTESSTYQALFLSPWATVEAILPAIAAIIRTETVPQCNKESTRKCIIITWLSSKWTRQTWDPSLAISFQFLEVRLQNRVISILAQLNMTIF